jgi:hypothetical protein
VADVVGTVADVVGTRSSKNRVNIRCKLGKEGRAAVQDTFENVFDGESFDRAEFMEQLIESIPEAGCWSFKRSIERIGPAPAAPGAELTPTMGSPLMLMLPDEALSLIANFVLHDFYVQSTSATEDRLHRLEAVGAEGGLFGQDPIVYIARENMFAGECMSALHWRLFERCAAPMEDHSFRLALDDDLRAHVRHRGPAEIGGLIWPYSRITRARFMLQSIFGAKFQTYAPNYTQLHQLQSVLANLELYRQESVQSAPDTNAITPQDES